MALKKFSELGHVHRGEPCQEYPGKWLSYLNGNEEKSFDSFEAAKKDASDRQSAKWAEGEAVTSVCWICSEDDPRRGEVWFTGFYQHGRFDAFGRYKS